MDTETIVKVVMQMKLPLECRYNEYEILKWRLQQAVELTKKETVNEIFEALLQNSQRYKKY